MDVFHFITALSAITSTFVMYKLLSWFRKQRKMLLYCRNTPGPKDFSYLYGNIHLFLKKSPDERLELMEEISKQHPKYFVIWMSPFKPIIFLNHPETIKVIFKTSEPKSKTTGAAYKDMLPWLGEGLLIAEGQRWSRSRRLLTSAFHFDILRPYTQVFNESADILLDELSKYADNGQSFELFQVVSSCTLDVILKCVFSYETGCQQNGDTHPYVEAVHQLARIVVERMTNILLSVDFIFRLSSEGRLFRKHCDFVHKVAEEVISKRRNELRKSDIPNRKYPDFLDILLTAKDENGVGMTDLEIRNEVDTFLFEGHDTTSSGISWVLYFLAKYPEHQEMVQQEIDAVLNDKLNNNIEWEDLPKLEYLTKCIKEGMRICAPVPGVGRLITKNFVIDGREFPAGTTVFLSIYLLHRNATVWNNPLNFDPERFTTENVAKMDPFAFCPFAAGPRNCIGQNFAMNEMKVIIAKFLYRYQVSLDLNHKISKDAALILRAEHGIKIYLKYRT